MKTTTFIGIDLAWKSERNPTGAALLKGNRLGAKLQLIATLRSMEEVLTFVRTHRGEESVVAIDAPLIITNETGQRACETAVGKRYGNRDASCHTSNTKLYPEAASVALAGQLLADGFIHVEDLKKKRTCQILAEVYPHAAMVAMFGLPKILKYKKGTLAKRRLGLTLFQNLLTQLRDAEPPLLPAELSQEILEKDLNQLPGKALKDYEDMLDAFFCAYLGFYFWYWGWERNELFGDTDSGYILNPTLPTESRVSNLSFGAPVTLPL